MAGATVSRKIFVESLLRIDRLCPLPSVKSHFADERWEKSHFFPAQTQKIIDIPDENE
jgi:hypothetical protein